MFGSFFDGKQQQLAKKKKKKIDDKRNTWNADKPCV